jgi:hypothetical protein
MVAGKVLYHLSHSASPGSSFIKVFIPFMKALPLCPKGSTS